MDVFSKKETIFATEYHNGMEDAWIVKDFADINEGYTLPRIFNSEKDAKKYIKNNLNAGICRCCSSIFKKHFKVRIYFPV